MVGVGINLLSAVNRLLLLIRPDSSLTPTTRLPQIVSSFGLAPLRRYAGKQRDHGSNRFGSPFSSKVVVCGHCLVTLSLTIKETLKWLSSLPILMQESFWKLQCSVRLSRGLGDVYKRQVTTRMTPALRWAAMRAILMFH